MNEPHKADTDQISITKDLLAKHFGQTPPAVAVKFGTLSHPGLIRTNNEDHFVVIERRRARTVLSTNLPSGFLPPADDIAYVAAVADGMGGAAFGELASMLSLRSAWEQAPKAIKWNWIITDREIQDLKERVALVFSGINAALQERMQADPQTAGMGTTLTAVYTVGPEAFIAHVGDSRAYLFHESSLTQLTRDHTVAQDCLDAKLPVLSDSWNHALTNCLGGSGEQLYVEFHRLRLGDGDQILLCTDGLTDMVSDQQIAGILGQSISSQDKAQAMVDLALQQGGRDNVTVVLAHYTLLK